MEEKFDNLDAILDDLAKFIITWSKVVAENDYGIRNQFNF